MKVTIDSGSGFCFGVVTAIRKAEEKLAEGELYCLGDIVHNSDEVERLERKGLKTVSHEMFAELRSVPVLLRAHGEPPSTYRMAHRNGIEIIDATCPVVLQLQKHIHNAYDAIAHLNPETRPQIVIYGKPGHAEVNGLVGQTDGTAIVVDNIENLDAIDFNRDIQLFSQTTKSYDEYTALSSKLNSLIREPHTVTTHDTICRQVSNRVNNIRAFAHANDVVIFVCGAKSSNGRVLYRECLNANPYTHLIANASEVNPEWFANSPEKVGICGATSTPRWIMEQVRDKIEQL